jgi:hypothetical protein
VIGTDTAALAKRAEWLSDQQRASVVAAVDAAQKVAATKAGAAAFETAITDATAVVDQTFGLASAPTSTTTTRGTGS